MRDGARHVRDAVVDDPVDGVGRVVVGGRARGLEAAALVDGDVDDQRSGLEAAQVVARDELGRGRAWDQDGADDDVGIRELGEHGRAVRVQDAGAAAEHLLELTHASGRQVQDGGVGAHADGQQRGLSADDAAAEDDDLGRRDTGRAADQQPGSAVRVH